MNSGFGLWESKNGLPNAQTAEAADEEGKAEATPDEILQAMEIQSSDDGTTGQQLQSQQDLEAELKKASQICTVTEVNGGGDLACTKIGECLEITSGTSPDVSGTGEGAEGIAPACETKKVEPAESAIQPGSHNLLALKDVPEAVAETVAEGNSNAEEHVYSDSKEGVVTKTTGDAVVSTKATEKAVAKQIKAKAKAKAKASTAQCKEKKSAAAKSSVAKPKGNRAGGNPMYRRSLLLLDPCPSLRPWRRPMPPRLRVL